MSVDTGAKVERSRRWARTRSRRAGRGPLVLLKWEKDPAQGEERVAQGCASSTEVSQAEKPSHPKEKIPTSNDPESSETATMSSRVIESHIPNAETAKVLREAREGKNLLHYDSLEEMFKDLGI